MNWQDLTAAHFAKAVTQVGGVCVLPIGVLEKHGDHLPLGTDYLWGSDLAQRAAAVEPAIVFPPYYLGQIHEAKHQPGTIAIRYPLMFDLLDNICDEIARNGLKKILILNSHGGNTAFLRHFALATLERPRDYVVYVLNPANYLPMDDPIWKAMKQTDVGGHACELETSLMLAAMPDLVHMGEISGDGQPRHRIDHLGSLDTGISWYAEFPDHYAGDATPATADKGRYILDYAVRHVAHAIRTIREDQVTAALTHEFYTRAGHNPPAP